MKFNVKALALSIGVIWAACVLAVGIANLRWPTYGGTFLNVVASIYSGVHTTDGLGAVVLGTLYAFIDGPGGGALTAWLYNRLAAVEK